MAVAVVYEAVVTDLMRTRGNEGGTNGFLGTESVSDKFHIKKSINL